MSLLSVISAICSNRDEYYCPKCGMKLTVQDGFDPDGSKWVCNECNNRLYDGQHHGVYCRNTNRYRCDPRTTILELV